MSIPSSRISDMQYLASLCPFAYGQAVYKARSELMRFGIDSNYDDKVNCAALGYLRLMHSKSFEDAHIGLMAIPNPATDQTTIYFSEPTYPKSILVMVDMVGNVVTEYIIKPGMSSLIINLKQLAPAVYTLQYSSGKTKADRIKITVIK